MTERKKITKESYTWEATIPNCVEEAAVAYEVNLTFATREKPEKWIPHLVSSDVLDCVEELKKGISSDIVDELCEDLDITRRELSQFAGVPERTLLRKIKEGRLTGGQSERMIRVARLLEKATQVLGTQSHAVRWLKMPRVQLRGICPLELADTELGAEEVVNLLGRIEHGVFA